MGRNRARWWLGAAAILVASFAVYAPALEGGFVWDDDTHLLDNPVLEENGLHKVWLTPPKWRPWLPGVLELCPRMFW